MILPFVQFSLEIALDLLQLLFRIFSEVETYLELVNDIAFDPLCGIFEASVHGVLRDLLVDFLVPPVRGI